MGVKIRKWKTPGEARLSHLLITTHTETRSHSHRTFMSVVSVDWECRTHALFGKKSHSLLHYLEATTEEENGPPRSAGRRLNWSGISAVNGDLLQHRSSTWPNIRLRCFCCFFLFTEQNTACLFNILHGRREKCPFSPPQRYREYKATASVRWNLQFLIHGMINGLYTKSYLPARSHGWIDYSLPNKLCKNLQFPLHLREGFL